MNKVISVEMDSPKDETQDLLKMKQQVTKQVTYTVGVLVVSDTVKAGAKSDFSGKNLIDVLLSGKHFVTSLISEECVSDDFEKIKTALLNWTDNLKLDLILTVGGTGFSPRDVTPEATKSILEKEAPHLASFMVLDCCSKTPFAALSRSVCGIRDKSLILNLPGSKKGSQECFEAIANILPHALDQLINRKDEVAHLHTKLQDVSQ